MNSGAYVAEIVRAGIESIDKGQTEAGRSLGLGAGQTMWLIVLPQAIKNILPALGNEFIVLVKETSHSMNSMFAKCLVKVKQIVCHPHKIFGTCFSIAITCICLTAIIELRQE